MTEFKDWRRAFTGGQELAKVLTPKGQVWPTTIPAGTVLWSGNLDIPSFGITTPLTIPLVADIGQTINGVRVARRTTGNVDSVLIPKNTGSVELQIGAVEGGRWSVILSVSGSILTLKQGSQQGSSWATVITQVEAY